MRGTALAVSLFLSVLACDVPRPSGTPSTPPPPAEFLLATLDSTFWVRTTARGARANGAPLLLASYGGRFYEIFVTDDDRSYDDALLVGQRLYRRDLVAGDSVVLFADTIVPRIAGTYARTHPLERPLQPDEDVRENPRTRATAEVAVLDVHGPYLSFQYHTDVAQPDGAAWHTTRLGVLDLRSGRTVRVEDLFADSVAARVLRDGRLEFKAAVDSVRRHESSGDSRVRRAATALSRFAFDERSFALAVVDTMAAVEFAPTGRGSEDEEDPLPLPPVTASNGPWWREVRPSLPTAEDSGAVDRWHSGGVSSNGYEVLARYDSVGETARVVLSTGGRAEWPVVSVMAPVQRIFWLDVAPVDSAQRRGLARAFSEASLYDETTRSVRNARRARGSVFFTASSSSRRVMPGHHRPKARAARALSPAGRRRS